MNAIFKINPYRTADGGWSFDDESVELKGEPFVCGIPEILDDIVGRGCNKFTAHFAGIPIPLYDAVLIHIRGEYDGNWYHYLSNKGERMEGWLCPALFKYFDETPKRIYIKVSNKG